MTRRDSASSNDSAQAADNQRHAQSVVEPGQASHPLPRRRLVSSLAAGALLTAADGPIGLFGLGASAEANAAVGTPVVDPGYSADAGSRRTARKAQALPSDVATVARRVSFGISPRMRRQVTSLGIDRWLEGQLDPAAIKDRKVDALLARMPTLAASNAANRDVAPAVLINELVQATLLRAVMSDRQLYEVMVEFWSDHFSIHLTGAKAYLKTADDRTVTRTHALTSFADLLLASAHSPAMLTYLDNARSNANSKQGVNENYGRELLELHTMGIADGVQPFTEEDVRGVALVLSGWTVDRDTSEFLYQPRWHHSGPVSLFGGDWTTPGNTGDAGYDDGVSLLRHLAGRPETARHIATKLVRRFVGDDPPNGLVNRLSRAYLANGTEIAPVLRSLFSAKKFRSPPTLKVRRPFDLTAAILRSYGIPLGTDSTEKSARQLRNALSSMGHRPFQWPAPDGYPDVGAYWANGNGLLQRWTTAALIGNNRIELGADPLLLVGGKLPRNWGRGLDLIGVTLLDRSLTDAETAVVLGHVGKSAGDLLDESSIALLREAASLIFASVAFQLR